jgi:hypothetical protein
MEVGYLLAKSVLPVIEEDEPAVIIDVCNNERRSAVVPPPAEDAAPANKDIDMATATEQVARPSADEDEQCTSAVTMTHLVDRGTCSESTQSSKFARKSYMAEYMGRYMAASPVCLFATNNFKFLFQFAH